MCPKISLKWDNFSSYLFPPTLSTDIAMQRCTLGNIFDNHFYYNTTDKKRKKLFHYSPKYRNFAG